MILSCVRLGWGLSAKVGVQLKQKKKTLKCMEKILENKRKHSRIKIKTKPIFRIKYCKWFPLHYPRNNSTVLLWILNLYISLQFFLSLFCKTTKIYIKFLRVPLKSSPLSSSCSPNLVSPKNFPNHYILSAFAVI